MQQEINRVASTTQFNGLNLLDGTLSNTLFQVGANANQTISMSISSSLGTALGNNKVASSTVAGSMAAAKAGPDNNVSGQTVTISGNGATSGDIVIGDKATAKAIAAAIKAAAGAPPASAPAPRPRRSLPK